MTPYTLHLEFTPKWPRYRVCLRGLSATIDRIIKYPEAWSPMSKHTCRYLMNRFPFGTIDQVKSGSVRTIAVADLRRRPDHWLDR